MGTASIYSNGTRTVAIQSTPGHDLENPLTFWFEGLSSGTEVYFIVSHDFNRRYTTFSDYEKVVDACDGIDGMREIIDMQPDFNGDAGLMSDDDVHRYVDKHFHVLSLGYGDHSCVWYYIGADRDWDWGPIGNIVTRKDIGQFAGDDGFGKFSENCSNLCNYLTDWANGNEYRQTEVDEDGTDWCWGYYGEDDAKSGADVDETYVYLGDCDEGDLDEDGWYRDLMVENFPDLWEVKQVVEHVPEKITVVPAHDIVHEKLVRKAA